MDFQRLLWIMVLLSAWFALTDCRSVMRSGMESFPIIKMVKHILQSKKSGRRMIYLPIGTLALPPASTTYARGMATGYDDDEYQRTVFKYGKKTKENTLKEEDDEDYDIQNDVHSDYNDEREEQTQNLSYDTLYRGFVEYFYRKKYKLKAELPYN